MGSVLIWNETAMCGGIIGLKMCVRYIYERWTSLERKYVLCYRFP